MLKTKFALLVALALSFSATAAAQATRNVSIKITVVNGRLELRPVPKFPIEIRRADDDSVAASLSTSVDGSTQAVLAPGKYLVSSVRPLSFEGKTYTWNVPLMIQDRAPAAIELSSDNASIKDVTAAVDSGRDISRGGELFRTLRNGVVTVHGELGAGSGFIVDNTGLVLTNQHVIDQSNEVRVRFNRDLAVRARVLTVDEERDLAVLQINVQAFPDCRPLAIASPGPGQPALLEGEHVFSIGSPLYEEKILSSGIASKVENGSIVTDVPFNDGSSGAPLFNSLGQVVGISTFELRDRSGSALTGNISQARSSGLSGIIPIAEAAAILNKARTIAASKGLPSPELMPNMPEGTFPIETIKTALADSAFPLKQYVSDVRNYQVKFMTPVYKFYVMEKDRIESLNNRKKRNKDKGVVETADPFKDLRYWSEFAGELRPVVQILALPETGASGKSLLLSALVQGTVGFSTPLDQKYKADFYQMKLMCDGREITPLVRNKTEIVRELQNYYKERKRYTYAGVYSYPYDVFAPGVCRTMQVQIFSEEDIETPITSQIAETTKARVWSDFQDFRVQTASLKSAPAKRQ